MVTTNEIFRECTEAKPRESCQSTKEKSDFYKNEQRKQWFQTAVRIRNCGCNISDVVASTTASHRTAIVV